MKRALLSGAAILIGVACSDGAAPVSDGVTPPPPDGGGGGPQDDGGGAPDADASSSDLDGGTDATADAEPWEPLDSICNPKMTLGAPSTATSTSNDSRFGAVTLDELTIAWAVPSGNAATLRVADRDSAASAFGAPHTPGGTIALDGVTIAPNGLTLLAVAEDRKSFVVYRRDTRTDSFSVDPAYDYQYANIVAALGQNELLGDPVFAFGDQNLYYSVYGGASADTVRSATRLSSGSAFDVSDTLAFTELRAQGSLRRRPTGVASDAQTMFYWDEVSGTEKLGRLQGTGASSFYQVHDLGAGAAFAEPNGDCTRVYFGGAGGTEIASAPVQ